MKQNLIKKECYKFSTEVVKFYNNLPKEKQKNKHFKKFKLSVNAIAAAILITEDGDYKEIKKGLSDSLYLADDVQETLESLAKNKLISKKKFIYFIDQLGLIIFLLVIELSVLKAPFSIKLYGDKLKYLEVSGILSVK